MSKRATETATQAAPSINWEAHQRRFLQAREKYVGLFGGVGNGKTFAACGSILSHASHNPGNLCLIGRLTYPELRDSTRDTFMRLIERCYPANAYTVNLSENRVELWNKSAIIFRHLDNDASLLSMNLGAFYIDQAEEVDEETFKTLQSRLRRENVRLHQGLVTGNPRGHDWVYYAFGMDKAHAGNPGYELVGGGVTVNRHNVDYCMVTAPTISNRVNLPADYIDQLRRSYSPEWFDRFVQGSWDAWTGQVWDVTKVQPYDRPSEYTHIFTACDPAISKDSSACDTAFVTVGVGKDGKIYVMEALKGKWSFLEQLSVAEDVLKRNGSRHLGVENVAYQRALVEACNRYFPDVTVHSLDADKDKFRRAKSVSHIIDHGLLRNNSKELLDQMSAFDPTAPKSSRVDLVDALVHALHMVQLYAPIEVKAPDKNKRLRGLSSDQIFFRLAEEQADKELTEDPRVRTVEFNPGRSGLGSDANYY
jgi:phage terminase large subunit